MDPFPSDDMMRYIYENYADGNRAMANEYITWLLDQRGRNPQYGREYAAILHMMNGGRAPYDHVEPENEDEFCYFYNPQMHNYTLYDLVHGMHPGLLEDWMALVLGPEPQEMRPNSPGYGPMDDADAAPPPPTPTHRMPRHVAQMCRRTASGKCAIMGNKLSKLDKSQRSVLTCGHVFKKSAIEAWLKQKGTCPLCMAIAEPQPGRPHLPYQVPAHVAANMRDWSVGRNCTISGQPLTADNICVTNCGHKFDRQAITSYLQTHGNVCPICKYRNCRIQQGGSHKKIKTKRIYKTRKSMKCRKSSKFRKSRKH
jgi:hypothetical protein